MIDPLRANIDKIVDRIKEAIYRCEGVYLLPPEEWEGYADDLVTAADRWRTSLDALNADRRKNVIAVSVPEWADIAQKTMSVAAAASRDCPDRVVVIDVAKMAVHVLPEGTGVVMEETEERQTP